MRLNKFILFLVVALTPCIGFSEVLWEQNFNNSPTWQSTPSETQDVSSMTTHSEAISMWNASSYRVSKQGNVPGGEIILETSPNAGRGGTGKGLIYWFTSHDDWAAASIDIAFNDPDITWKTPAIDKTGYQEIWLTMWYKTPDDMIWYDPANPSNSVGFTLFKGCRFWAYSVEDYISAYNTANGTSFSSTPEGHWAALMDDNATLSSHYLIGGTFYKKPFYIITWYGQTLSSYPAWLKETDADAGTSGFPQEHNRNDYGTHLIGGNNWWNQANPPIPGLLNDNQWHKIEYHAKLNDLGEANSAEEVYVDGVLLHGLANNQVIRVTDRKFQQVILFDNYHRTYGGRQALYIDDIVISTTRLPNDYVIGGPPGKRYRLRIQE